MSNKANINPTPIYSNSNLNDYRTPGFYAAVKGGVASIQNSPDGHGNFALLVEITNSNLYGIKQTFTSYINGDTYIRTSNTNSNDLSQWSAWKRLATNEPGQWISAIPLNGWKN